MTDAKGNYVLTTGGAPFGTGAIPGEYNVLLSKVSNSGSGQVSLEEFNAMKESGESAPSGPMNRVVHEIPEKYSKATTSGLAPVTVGSNASKNVFDFDIKNE